MKCKVKQSPVACLSFLACEQRRVLGFGGLSLPSCWPKSIGFQHQVLPELPQEAALGAFQLVFLPLLALFEPF